MHKGQDAGWHTRPVRGIGINIWAPDWYEKSILNFDAEQLADALEKAHVPVALTFQGFTQDIWGNSFFPLVFAFNAYVFNRNRWTSGADFEHLENCADIHTSLSMWTKGSRHTGCIWQAGFLSRFLRGLTDKPVWIQMARHAYGRDCTTSPLHEMMLNMHAIVANGANPFFIDSAYPDGRPSKIAYRRMGKVLEQLAHYREHLDTDDELTHVGVVYSRKSRDYWDITTKTQRYMEGLESSAQILIEGKVPYQILPETKLNASQLAEYPVILLPNNAVMSDTHVLLYQDYVRNGGALIATGTTSLIAENGNRRPDFGLREVLGVRYDGPLTYPHAYLKLENHAISGVLAEEYDEEYAYFPEEMTQINPCAEIETAARLVLPASAPEGDGRYFTFSPQDVPPGNETDHPAIAAHRYGKGRCVYFAGDITRAYGSSGYPELRKLFLHALAWVSPKKPPLRVEAPLTVECHGYVKANRLLIHLVNHTVADLRLRPNQKGSQAEQGVPCHNIRVHVHTGDTEPQRVYLASSGKQIPFTSRSKMVSFSVPELDLFEIAIVECRTSYSRR